MSKEIKLSDIQKHHLKVLRNYPKDIVMHDGWLTGGHGIKLHLGTIRALQSKGLIDKWGENRDRISELGKTIEL